MGLRKHVQLPNGVQLNYFRISTVQHVVNRDTMMLVLGYTSQAKRREEGEADVYVWEQWYTLPYDDALTVPDAYAWLKQQPELAGAEDAIEEE